MIWSWLSFATGYLIGGVSALLGLGLFLVGGRVDTADDTVRVPRPPVHNTGLRLVPQDGSTNSPGLHPETATDQSA